MKKSIIIDAFNQAFLGMKKRKERFVIVRIFDEVETLFLPTGNNVSTNNIVRIDLILDPDPVIRVLYDKNKQENFSFYTDEEKEFVVDYLEHNNILPTVEEILQARSLMNIEQIAFILGGCDYYCDYEDSDYKDNIEDNSEKSRKNVSDVLSFFDNDTTRV